MYRVEFATATERDFRALGHAASETIIDAIHDKLTTDPYAYGDSLKGDLAGYYKLRISRYRVIYVVLDDTVHVVLVLGVGIRADGDRRDVYRQLTPAKLAKRKVKHGVSEEEPDI